VGKESKIEWTDATWNPVTGCTKVSPGCTNCYAETFAERWRGTPGHPYEQGFDLKLWPSRLEYPLRWKKPKLIFVNSMSDLFHKDVPDEFIIKVFEVMRKADWHTFQVLTKRHKRLLEMDSQGLLEWAPNIWAGVSVESSKYLERVEALAITKAHTKFLSLEPLLGPLPTLYTYLAKIDWVIVGGESGPGARPMKEEWVIDIRDQCEAICSLQSSLITVKFFFKQWGGRDKRSTGRLLQGQTYDAMPEFISR